MKRDYSKVQDLGIKSLAIFGLLSLLALGSFTTISLLKYAPKAFSYVSSAAVSLSSVFISSEEDLIVKSNPTTVETGSDITVSWEQTGEIEGGSYIISYPCLQGFHFESKSDGEMIFCNTAFRFVNENDSISITPVSTKNRFVDMPITVYFTKNGESSPSKKGVVTVTVSNEDLSKEIDTAPITSVETPRTNTNQNTNTSSQNSRNVTQGQRTEQVFTIPTTQNVSPNNPNGVVDLKVTIIEVGVVDKITNSFASSQTLRRSDRIGVKFSVENIGDKASGEWRFNAILPTFPHHIFNSDSQPSLKPGDKIEFTIGFDQAIEGNQEFKVVIDPQSLISEKSEENNTAKTNFQVL